MKNPIWVLLVQHFFLLDKQKSCLAICANMIGGTGFWDLVCVWVVQLLSIVMALSIWLVAMLMKSFVMFVQHCSPLILMHPIFRLEIDLSLAMQNSKLLPKTLHSAQVILVIVLFVRTVKQIMPMITRSLISKSS